MTDSSLKMIKQLLPTLSSESLRQVHEATSALLGMSDTAQERQSQSRVEMLCDALRTVSEAERSFHVAPYGALKRTNMSKKLQTAVDTLDSEIDQWFAPERATRVQRIALYRLFGILSTQQLSISQIPVSLNSVCGQAGRFFGLVDNAFPGYIRAGRIDVILDGM